MKKENLYLCVASRYLNVHSIKNIRKSYGLSKLVVAPNEKDAGEKLIAYLRKKTGIETWDKPLVKELVLGKNIPLETRLEILGELFEMIK